MTVNKLMKLVDTRMEILVIEDNMVGAPTGREARGKGWFYLSQHGCANNKFDMLYQEKITSIQFSLETEQAGTFDDLQLKVNPVIIIHVAEDYGDEEEN